jgi:hypothetical protein
MRHYIHSVIIFNVFNTCHSRLVFLHVHKRSILLLAGCFVASKTSYLGDSFIFRKRFTRTHVWGNMVGVLGFSIDTFPEGIWYWQPHGGTHIFMQHDWLMNARLWLLLSQYWMQMMLHELMLMLCWQFDPVRLLGRVWRMNIIHHNQHNISWLLVKFLLTKRLQSILQHSICIT